MTGSAPARRRGTGCRLSLLRGRLRPGGSSTNPVVAASQRRKSASTNRQGTGRGDHRGGRALTCEIWSAGAACSQDQEAYGQDVDLGPASRGCSGCLSAVRQRGLVDATLRLLTPTRALGLYLADEPATAIAEWYRLLAERGLSPGRAIPHDHHVWQLDLQLADLSTPERLARVRLTAPTTGRRTWPPFQAAGEQLFRTGFAGISARSSTSTCQLHLRPRRLAFRRLPAPENH